MIFKTIKFSVKNKIGYLQFSSPPQNRMSSNFFSELSLFFEKELPEIDINGLIITGEGRHFSSGADTEELIDVIGGLSNNEDSFLKRNVEAFGKLEKLKIPTVAAVKGCCFGAALELALSCTFILSASNAVFSMPESEFGLMPGCGGTVKLTERTGAAKALELILTGRTFSVEEALENNIVDFVCNKKELIQLSEDLISKSTSREMKI